MIKLWIDPVTAAKCVFIRANQLHDYIDPADIPEDVYGVLHSRETTPENSVARSASNMSFTASLEESMSSATIAADGSSSSSVERHLVESKVESNVEEDHLPHK
jgi:hypothetical protein